MKIKKENCLEIKKKRKNIMKIKVKIVFKIKGENHHENLKNGNCLENENRKS